MSGFLCLITPHVLAGSDTPTIDDTQQAFWSALSALCGSSYDGRVTEYDETTDSTWAQSTLTIHVRDCGASRIEIPLHVGDDRSRTWLISRLEGGGLELKHDHRHQDGSEDVVTYYGGHTSDSGTSSRQAFPADSFSQSLFFAEGLPVSVDNIWYLEIHPGEYLAYGLTRPNRHFRAEFDLSKTVPTPPAAWGVKP